MTLEVLSKYKLVDKMCDGVLFMALVCPWSEGVTVVCASSTDVDKIMKIVDSNNLPKPNITVTNTNTTLTIANDKFSYSSDEWNEQYLNMITWQRWLLN